MAQAPCLKPSQRPGRAGAHGVLMSALVPDPALLGGAPQEPGHGPLFLGTPAAAQAPEQSPPPATVPAEAGAHCPSLLGKQRLSRKEVRSQALEPREAGVLVGGAPRSVSQGAGGEARKAVWRELTEGSQTSIVPTGALGCSETLNGARAWCPTQGQGGWRPFTRSRQH